MDGLKVGSLFSGIGGIDLGFQKAGFDIAFANEIDKYACKTYRYNFPDCNLIEGDICKIDDGKLSPIDVLCAGFPCQPFSVCGKKEGFKDNRGNLFFNVMDIVDDLKPPVIFLENVANLAEHDNGRTFNIIHNELVSRNYYIRYLIADASDYDIPQHRTRIYIVALKSWEACENLCFPSPKKSVRRIFDIIDRTVKVNDSYYLSSESPQYRKLENAMKDSEQIYRFADFGIQISKGGISFTLKANMGTWYNRVPYIRDNFGIRQITPYECLALQGFPKEFKFPKIPIKSAYKQCGNTVCVPIVQSIAEQIRKVLQK